MRVRAITGFFFIIIMLASVLLGHYVFGVFFLLLSAFCLWEFYTNLKKSGLKPDVSTGLLNGIFIYTVFALITYDNDPAYHKLLFLLPVTLSSIFIQ
jgi:phosphatidate cytidylyltransferase